MDDVTRMLVEGVPALERRLTAVRAATLRALTVSLLVEMDDLLEDAGADVLTPQERWWLREAQERVERSVRCFDGATLTALLAEGAS